MVFQGQSKVYPKQLCFAEIFLQSKCFGSWVEEKSRKEFSSMTLLCSWNYRRLCVHLGMSGGHRSSPPRGLIIHFRESSRVQSGRSQSAVLRPTLCVHISLRKLRWGGQRDVVSSCRERSGQSLHVVAW